MPDRRRPGVKLVRGPFVRLPPHEQHCDSQADFIGLCANLRRRDRSAVLAADLFAGAGGMSLGLERAGMRVVLGADHDVEALETHRHHFGGLALDWDLGDPDAVERLADLLRRGTVDVLAGGPPCQPFSKAGRSGMRHLVRAGLREPHDKRRDLWRSFLEVVRLAEPRAVIMENVPDMALDREMFILRSVVFELERLGYNVQERVLDAWRFGVPQFRQRLILVGVREGTFKWPNEAPRKVTLANAISDLPAVEGGWRPSGGAHGWATYEGPNTAFQRQMRASVAAPDRDKVFDQITRPVRDDDLQAFELIDSKTRYSELPEELKRYRDDIFDDKYKRLDGDDVSRTITAHIAKDGYWYIHPEQNRTLTVREAARVQTFPDDFRFAGPPSAAFKQIGNAVPPRLGEAVGRAVIEALVHPTPAPPSSERIASELTAWFREPRTSTLPWLHANSRWHALLGELLLDRVTKTVANSVWPLLEKFSNPADLLQGQDELQEVAAWLGREDRAERICSVAQRLNSEPDISDDALAELVQEGLIGPAVAELVMLVQPTAEEPVIASSGALRVASRFNQNRRGRMNRNTDGRIAIAKLIGYGAESRSAHLALMELGESVCTPAVPSCAHCPLRSWCLTAPSHAEA